MRDLQAQSLEALKAGGSGSAYFPTPPGSSGVPAAETDPFKLSGGQVGLEGEVDDLDQLIRSVSFL